MIAHCDCDNNFHDKTNMLHSMSFIGKSETGVAQMHVMMWNASMCLEVNARDASDEHDNLDIVHAEAFADPQDFSQ